MNRDTSSDTRGGGTTSHRMTFLQEGFSPGDDDVICGRGKKCYSHIGNERFRQRVTKMLGVYSQAKSKLDKSNVLSAVVDQVRHASPDGGFIKQAEDGRWADVGDFLAREKTSQAFRDALHEQYKSSTVAKKKRRQRESIRTSDKLPARHEIDVSKRLDMLTAKVARSGSDDHIHDLFNRSNAEIMNRINLLSRGALREDMTTSSEMAHPASRLSEMNSTANFNPFEFGSAQGPKRGVVAYSSFPPHSRSRMVSRSASAPASPPHTPFRALSYREDLHHSMPNINYSHDMLPFDGNSALGALNLSVPTLHYSHEDPPVDSAPNDLEPIPFDHYSPQNRKGSIKKATFMANAAAAAAKGVKTGTRPRSAATENDDLLACLAKLTEATIVDDNPFEPIPLANSSEHMISVLDSEFDDGDMGSDFEEDEADNLSLAEPQRVDTTRSS